MNTPKKSSEKESFLNWSPFESLAEQIFNIIGKLTSANMSKVDFRETLDFYVTDNMACCIIKS